MMIFSPRLPPDPILSDAIDGIDRRGRETAATAAESINSTATLGRILHPSPASPAANKDFAGTAKRQLIELGIWNV